MTDFTFAPATKEQAKARVAFAGPSGSGKTYTALVTALTFGQKVAVIDTEHRSASKYSDLFKFHTLAMHRYDPRDLVKALAIAGQSGFEVVVVDSLSHFWSGADGMLEQVDRAAPKGNNFAGWKEARPMERAMLDALLGYPGHVVVTMRTKTAYEITTDDRGKSKPVKIGLKPEQRDGIEYEFDIVGDLDVGHRLTVSKSRCAPLADAVIDKPGEEFAQQILDWLGDGVPAASALDHRARVLSGDLSYADLRALYDQVAAKGLAGAAVIDSVGEPTTLGELIVLAGREARTREQAMKDGAA